MANSLLIRDIHALVTMDAQETVLRGLPPDSVVQSEDRIRSDWERVIGKYDDPKPGSMLRVALAPCSPFSVSED